MGRARALKQGVAVGGVVLCVALFNRQRQAAHFLAHLDAKRAGAELVQRQALALLVHAGLRRSVANHASGVGQALFEQHDGTQNDAQGSEECTDDGFHRGLKFQKWLDEKVWEPRLRGDVGWSVRRHRGEGAVPTKSANANILGPDQQSKRAK